MIIGMQFFANRNIEKMKSSELEKAIVSWKAMVELHRDKIQNPQQYYPRWNEFDERYKNGLRQHWTHEIQTFEHDIDLATEELKKRGVI